MPRHDDRPFPWAPALADGNGVNPDGASLTYEPGIKRTVIKGPYASNTRGAVAYWLSANPGGGI
jgi:hypothetical protein